MGAFCPTMYNVMFICAMRKPKKFEEIEMYDLGKDSDFVCAMRMHKNLASAFRLKSSPEFLVHVYYANEVASLAKIVHFNSNNFFAHVPCASTHKIMETN